MLRERVADAISRARDSRRRFRKTLDELFGRKFVASVVVGGHVVALLRTGPYALLAPSQPFHPTLFAILATGTAFWITVVIRWKQLAERASEAAEAAEEAVDPDE